LPPGPHCRRSNGSNRRWKYEEGGGGDERRRESGPLERTGDGESRMKNAITILKNGPSLLPEKTSMDDRF